jgi:hypothetical protein
VYEVMPEGQDATIEMDETHFIVDLYVNGLGDVTYVQSKVSNTDKRPIVFENGVMTANLIIQKKVNDGAAVSADQTFKFWMKIPTGGKSIDLNAGDIITGTKKVGENATEDVPITVGGSMEQETGETAKNTAVAANGWCSFTLKNGQSVTFANLPAGMVYYLFEEDYSKENFTTYCMIKQGEAIVAPTEDSEYKVTHYDETTATNVPTYLGTDGSDQLEKGQNGVFYLNDYETLTSTSTGITVDILPYAVVVLAVVAAFAVLMVSKKRRNVRYTMM